MSDVFDSIEQKIIELNWSKSPGTVKELIEIIEDELNISSEEGRKIVDGLILKGELSLVEQEKVSIDLIGYILSDNAVWFRISAILSVLTLLTVLLIGETNFPYVYIRNFLGSIFVIILPGYSVIKILYPLKEIAFTTRAVLSVGMSITIVCIIGLMLNYTPWGISLYPLITTLFFLVIILSFIGIQREQKMLEMESK